jgi:hypothetical protein
MNIAAWFSGGEKKNAYLFGVVLYQRSDAMVNVNGEK